MMQPPLPESINFGDITNLVESMVLGSLDSFVKRDAQIARGILAADDAVDKARNRIQLQLIELMQKGSVRL